MAIGTVKWFNPTKGYGFIAPDDDKNGKDVFIHITALQSAGIKNLNEGQRISYELASDKGKTFADKIKILDAD